MDEAALAEPASLPGPDSVTWQRFGVLPGVFVAGTGLLLQVAHPVVGAGVLEHSEFRRKPWLRAWRTHLSTMRFVYGTGDGAHAEGKRLLDAHKSIKGVDAAGRRYHALDPEAYAWVHLTLARFMVDTAEWFGRPMTASERERMWQEFRAIGLALGIKAHHLAEDWATADAWFTEVVAGTLETNQSTRDVLDSLVRPVNPFPFVPDRLWRIAIGPAGRLLRLTTVGTLPATLRERLGVRWDAADERRLRRFARVVRGAMRVCPEPVRYAPLPYAAIVRARLRARWEGGT